MSAIAFELIIIILLIALNGVFALSEIAIVTARKIRLEQAASDGNAGAAAALELANAPTRFLSTIQLGITSIGILAGAFAGATLAQQLSAGLEGVWLIGEYSTIISVGIVVVAITYLSVIFGELVPKRLALGHAERIASVLAPPMKTLARFTAPVVYLLSQSTELVFRLLRVKPSQEPAITEEEIKIMLNQGTASGALEHIEQELIERVIRLGNRTAEAVMTTRTEITWLDMDDSPQAMRDKITMSGHSCFPVCRGNLDNVKGIVLAKNYLSHSLVSEAFDLESLLQPALFIPEGVPAFEVLKRFKDTRTKIVLMIDEYGGVQGLMTITDIVEAIVGDISKDIEPTDTEVFQREDGSFLLDAKMPIDEFKELFKLRTLPYEGESYYQTLGGFIMVFLRRVPSSGDVIEWGGMRLEVVDMDGRRVDKVLLSSLHLAKPSESTTH